MSEIKLGDKVSKRKGYAFNGVVVAVFVNTKGQTRIVAEHTGSQTEESGGMLHIFSESQLQQVSKLPIHGISGRFYSDTEIATLKEECYQDGIEVGEMNV